MGHHGAIYQETGLAALDGAARAALVSTVTGKSFGFSAESPAQHRERLTAAGLPPFIMEGYSASRTRDASAASM
jgi:NAD(P)H dehydrogenase (quinone)